MHRVVIVRALVALAQSPTAPKKGGNSEAAKIKNPVAANPESIAAGKRSYTRLCSKCHGAGGARDGTRATGPVPPQDMTDEKGDYGGSGGENFAAIKESNPQSPRMEGDAARMSDADIWNVVNYVRTLARRR